MGLKGTGGGVEKALGVPAYLGLNVSWRNPRAPKGTQGGCSRAYRIGGAQAYIRSRGVGVVAVGAVQLLPRPPPHRGGITAAVGVAAAVFWFGAT